MWSLMPLQGWGSAVARSASSDDLFDAGLSEIGEESVMVKVMRSLAVGSVRRRVRRGVAGAGGVSDGLCKKFLA